MSIDLPLGRLRWTSVSDQKSNGRVKYDRALGLSAIRDQNSRLYIFPGSRCPDMVQKVAGSPAPGKDGLLVQPSVLKSDVIAAIRIEALIQTAYHVLNAPEEVLSLPVSGDLHLCYSAWIQQYCDTHYLHFLHQDALQMPMANLGTASTHPLPSANQQQIRCRHGNSYISRRQLYHTFANNGYNAKLDKPARLGLVKQRTTSCTDQRTFQSLTQCSSSQVKHAPPVYSPFACVVRSLSAIKRLLESERYDANCMSGYVSIGSGSPEREEEGEVETQRTGNSFEQEGIDHGRSVEKHQRHATWPSMAGKKRSANAEESSDDDDDGDNEKRPRKSNTHKEKSSRYACPFYKRNPDAFAGERSCCGPGWISVQRVKEHIFRKHKAPQHQCPRCFQEFKNDCLVKEHCRAHDLCKVRPNPFASFQVDESTMRLLKQRGKTTATEDEKWYGMYKTIWPNAKVLPTPCEFYNARYSLEKRLTFGRVYETKDKGPELPSKAVAQEMFRENLNGVISSWGLGGTDVTMGYIDPQMLNFMKSGAMAAFNETLSALYRPEASPTLDDKIPAIAASPLQTGHERERLWPLVEDSDAEGKALSQAHKFDDVSDCALTHYSAPPFNTQTWDLGMEQGWSSQRPIRKALTAPVSRFDGQTIDTSCWHLQPSTPPVNTQHQALQEQQSQALSQQFKCNSCGAYFTRQDNLCAHGNYTEQDDNKHNKHWIERKGHRCQDRSLEPKVRAWHHDGRESSGPKSDSTSFQRQGPSTPVETLEEGNRRVIFDHHSPNEGVAHNDTLVEVLDYHYFSDVPKTGSKGKGVEGEGRVLDTETSNHWVLNEVGIGPPPALPNPWQMGLGGIWSPNHQNGNSRTTTDDHGFDDTV